MAACCNLPSSAGGLAAQAKKRDGRASRDKGNRFERTVVKLLQDHGLGAERVPLSGAAGGSYSGDLTVPILGRDLVVEAKARANGFAQLYSWLEDRDILIVKADRRHALVVLPLRLAVEIATHRFSEAMPRENGCPGHNQDSRSHGHFGQERSNPMRLIVRQTESAGNMFWIVKDMHSGWLYHGPFADEASTHAFARPKNSADWKALLRAARLNRKALATEESIEEETADIAA